MRRRSGDEMHTAKIVVIYCLVGFLYGCAAPRAVEDYSHTPASEYSINKTRNVKLGFDEAWDAAVYSLSSTFYTINNIAKESRIINVSFRLSDPKKYIDCGVSKRVITYDKKTLEFEYLVAGSDRYDFLWSTPEGYHVWADRKSTRLNSSHVKISYAVFCL